MSASPAAQSTSSSTPQACPSDTSILKVLRRPVEFTQYPAIIRLWENAWSEFVPFLDYDVEIRRVICSTNAVESINARYRRAIRARGHFPTDQAAMKCLYLVTRSLDPTGRGRARWAMRWKPALNAPSHLGNYVTADNHLQRPDHPDRQLTNAKVGFTVNQTAPRPSVFQA